MSETLERPASAPATALPATRVLFRRFRAAPKAVIALLPDLGAGTAGVCQSYTAANHLAAVSYAATIAATCAPDLRDQEVTELLNEVKALGYRPKVVLRYSRPA